MKNIFEQGAFRDYSRVSLNESRSPILGFSQYEQRKTTVFISHKHDDLEDLKVCWDFFNKNMGLRFTLIVRILQCLK